MKLFLALVAVSVAFASNTTDNVNQNADIVHSGDGKIETQSTTNPTDESPQTVPPQTTTKTTPSSAAPVINSQIKNPCEQSTNPCRLTNTQCVPFGIGNYACPCQDDFEMDKFGNCVFVSGVTTIETVTVDMGVDQATFGPENTLRTTTVKLTGAETLKENSQSSSAGFLFCPKIQ